MEAVRIAYVSGMSVIGSIDNVRVPAQPDDERERRLRVAREAELIAAARARLDAGEGLTGDMLWAWFDAFGHTDDPVHVPRYLGGCGDNSNKRTT